MNIPLGVPKRGWSFSWACPRKDGHSLRHAKKGCTFHQVCKGRCGHLLQCAKGGWTFSQPCQGRIDILMGVPKKDGYSLRCVRGLAHYHTQGFTYHQAQSRIGMVYTRPSFLRARHTAKPNRVQVWLTLNLACSRFCTLLSPIASRSGQRQTQLSQGLAHCQTLRLRTWHTTKPEVLGLARARPNAHSLGCACCP